MIRLESLFVYLVDSGVEKDSENRALVGIDGTGPRSEWTVG